LSVCKETFFTRVNTVKITPDVTDCDQRPALLSNVGTNNRATFLVPTVSEDEVSDSLSQFGFIAF
jgi:hypothetical protein